MTRIALTATLAASLLTGFVQAQAPAAPPQDGQYPHHHRQPNPQKEAEHLAKRLNLSQQQAAQLEPILAEREQKMEALRQSENSITAAQMFQQRREIMKNTEQQLAGVLSPEQMQEMRHMHHRGPGGPGGQWQGRQNGGQPGV